MSSFLGIGTGNGSELDKFNQNSEGKMKNQNPDVALGRAVRSPNYGKGFIAAIEVDAIKVRFWKGGYKTFHKPEGDYPFQLLDEVRPVEQKSLVERVLARETRTEKKNRARTCQHGENPHFCLKCAGLKDTEIEKWNRHRSTDRHINPRGLSLNSYVPVKISSSDRILISRRENALPADEISNGYQCRQCGTITDARTTAARLVLCPHCNEALVPIPEPFQNSQFSKKIGNGARSTNYVDAEPIQRAQDSEEAASARGLYTDPNSRFQEGGTGYLRIPLDTPRSTRGDAPEWLDCRESFLQNLRKSRSERAERILHGFYVEEKTDEQIAESVGWTKGAIKKERKQLLERGDNFFRSLAAKHPLAQL